MKDTKPTIVKNKKPKSLAYLYAVGRRKNAVARLRFHQKTDHPDGTILIKGKLAKDVLSVAELQIAQSPIFLIAQKLGGYFSVQVSGGGRHAQAEAIRHGIARILFKINADWRKLLKSKGYLTRDSRSKERKKPGLKRARRSPQWSKR